MQQLDKTVFLKSSSKGIVNYIKPMQKGEFPLPGQISTEKKKAEEN